MRRRLTLLSVLVLALPGAATRATAPTAAGGGAGWISLPPSLIQRQEVQAAGVGPFIYVAGGFDQRGFPQRAVERYDTRSNSWSEVAPMPLSLNHSVAVSYRGAVYVIGGYANEPSGLNARAILLRYDPSANRWSELPSPPTKRGAFAAGVVGHRLYVAGGYNPTQGELARLDVYDFKTRTWSRGPDMPTPREHTAGAVSDGRFCVMGGRTDPLYLTGDLKVVECFDPRTKRWTRLPDLHYARSSTSAVSVGNDIVVFGGEDLSGVVKQVEEWAPRTASWRQLPDMPTPRHALGAVAVGSRIYTIEGTPMPRIGASNVVQVLVLPSSGKGPGHPPVTHYP